MYGEEKVIVMEGRKSIVVFLFSLFIQAKEEINV